MHLNKKVGLVNLSKNSLRELSIQISWGGGKPRVDILHITISICTKT